MAKQKYLTKIEELFEKSPVVSFSDIDRIVRHKKNTNYAKQIVNNLISRGKIKRLTKGCYTKFDEAGLSVLCFKPAYLGLQSALSFHKLWEQEAIPVIITSNSIRPSVRKTMGMNILTRRAKKEYIFGYEYFDDAGFYLPYSDIEKTFIDFVVFRNNLSPEIIKEFRRRIDTKKINKYLKKYPKMIQTKVRRALTGG